VKAVALDPLQATAARRLGHRLLGPALPYLLHLRPAEWPIMAAHTALGWLLASGLAVPDGRFWVGLVGWVIGLNGGTLALNSAFDRDAGDVAYLRQPPAAPASLAGFAVLLMVAGLVASWGLGITWRVLYLVCLLMSIAYSVPPVRLKRIGGLDWLVNMVGFGALTPWAGWAITGRALDLEHALVLWAFCPLFAGLYPLTQLYQLDDDRARGDRTLALRLGVTNSLRLALLAILIAFGLIVAAALVGGWPDRGGLRWTAVAIALAAWLVVLVPWHHEGRGWSSRRHQAGMYHALAAWAITDVAVLLAWTG
jgi:4-hydroxybenzoate polyprenyltransferase